MRQWRMSIASALMLAAVSCQDGRVIDTFCVTERPYRPTKAEIAAMSDATITRMLSHNARGEKACGWKP
jgi:hypothetical protein